MAVVGSARERYQERRTSYEGHVWTATRAWIVETDSWTDREDTVSGASGLPAYGALHPNPIGAAMYARSISYQPLDAETPMAWRVEAGYSSERSFDPTDPEQDEVLISFTSEIYQRAIFEDKDNKAIMNTANDPFDPAPMADNAHLIATIRSNHQAIPTWILTYVNAVNSAAFTISGLSVGAGLACVRRINVGERQRRGTTTFFPLTTEIHIQREGWRLEPLNQGYNEILLSKKRPILVGDDLHETTVPQPLKLDGEFDADATPATAVYLNFRIYDELDFSVLPGIT